VESIRYLTFAVVTILVSAALFSVDMATASGPTAITVIQQTVEIDYGKKIKISTRVDTGTIEIATVRALFRPRGGKTVWIYSYPNFSIEAGSVSLDFEIPTGPGYYYPPGVEFDIEVEVTSKMGEISSVISPESIEYLDPDISWERVEGDGYTVIYYGVSRSEVENLTEAIDFRIPMLQATLGMTETPDFKAVVFPSIKAATPSFPPVSQTATDEFLFAGFAQPQYRLFVQGQLNSTTFTHELAHLYTHEAVASAFQGGIPSWLGEGLARFLETGSSESSNARLISSVRPDELLPLRNMISIPGKRSDVFIFYPQAGAFVGYLIEEFGHDSMADLLALINDGESLQSGFELTFGKSLYKVENDWRATFNAAALVVPTATVQSSGSTADSVVGTQIPLVDFEPLLDEVFAPSSTVSPASLPTVIPKIPPVQSDIAVPADDDPNYMAAAIVIVLSIAVGVWLFTSRRKSP
jgi:hypothetical protein